jgi:hypothetical protein
MESQRVDTIEAASWLGLKPGTLEVWRSLGRGPRFLKIGRKVFYKIEDLELFANAHVVETIDSRELKDRQTKFESSKEVI